MMAMPAAGGAAPAEVPPPSLPPTFALVHCWHVFIKRALLSGQSLMAVQAEAAAAEEQTAFTVKVTGLGEDKKAKVKVTMEVKSIMSQVDPSINLGKVNFINWDECDSDGHARPRRWLRRSYRCRSKLISRRRRLRNSSQSLRQQVPSSPSSKLRATISRLDCSPCSVLAQAC